MARDKILTYKIQRILEQKQQLEKQDLSADTRRADDYIAELELGRDLSQTVVHEAIQGCRGICQKVAYDPT